MKTENCPGLYLDGTVNKFYIAMDTFGVSEVVEVPDIPVKKWISVIIRLENRHLDIYINGTIVVRHELKHVVKQNINQIKYAIIMDLVASIHH